MKSGSKLSIIVGTISAAMAVLAGAFVAHGLKQILSPEMLSVFETAVRYQMYHAFALIVTGMIASQSKLKTNSQFRFASALFASGTILFSGSLYALVLMNVRWLGMVTPVGGICFVAGWAFFAIAVWKSS